MDNEKLVRNWQKKIISLCEDKLCRRLNKAELNFITARGGFMALEVIEDTVSTITGAELEEYLNSENES